MYQKRLNIPEHKITGIITETEKEIRLRLDPYKMIGGRRTEVLDGYYAAIGEDNCRQTESIALDGAHPFIASTGKYAVNATIVYDKFHIIQKLNRAVDMTRKQELRKAR